MLKLFYAPGSCALASHIALEEAGADYTGHRVDTMRRRAAQAGISRDQPEGVACPRSPPIAAC